MHLEIRIWHLKIKNTENMRNEIIHDLGGAILKKQEYQEKNECQSLLIQDRKRLS